MSRNTSKALSFDPFNKADLLQGDAKHIIIITITIFGDYDEDII